MNYYEEIKNELMNNEFNRQVKDYSKNKYELQRYYNVGKLLLEAGNQYGESIIKEYSKKLIAELGKKYSVRYLYDIRKLYLFSKVHPLGAQLTMSHYRLLFPLSNDNEVNYYINQVIGRRLSKRQLEEIIKSKEYERLPDDTKNKLVKKEDTTVVDYIKNPIIIKNNYDYEIFSEKVLQKLIMEDISSFLKELGDGFTFVDNEYKIKLGDRYNYIDILLYNIKFKCYVVVELKVTEVNSKHTGQIQNYMSYIDRNVKNFDDNKTVGIIICKRDNKYVIDYCSDERIVAREYELV